MSTPNVISVRRWYQLNDGCRPLLNEIVVVLLPDTHSPGRQVLAVFDPSWEHSFYLQSPSGGKEALKDKPIGWRPHRHEVVAVVHMRPSDGGFFE